MEEVTIFKLFSIVSIWLIGFIGGLLPVVAARKQQHSPFVQHIRSVLNAFSGGVFLAGGFFHLLHAAIENPALQKWSSVDEGRYAFPYAEMFSTMGFLGLLLIEQAAHLQLHQSSKPSSSDVDEEDEEETGTEDYVEEVEDDIEAQSFVTRTKRQRTAHGHSHLVTGSTSSTVAMILFLALSFHSVLEGLGIGAQTTPAWGVFLAIILHKGLAAFALGSGMVQSSLPLTHVLVYMIVFSFMSIIGILVGWMIAADTTEDSAAAGICVALASGTFIYVAVMEVIPQEFPRHPPSSSSTTHVRTMMHKITALCLGYALFGLLAKWS